MMKFPLLAILLFISGSAFAQTQTEKEIKSLLTNKWKATQVKAGDQILPIQAALETAFLDIKPNGTLIAGESTKQKNGKWRYDHKTKTLTTEMEKNTLKHEVVRISKTELVLRSVIEGIILNLSMKRVN
jgi:hypothetical protein